MHHSKYINELWSFHCACYFSFYTCPADVIGGVIFNTHNILLSWVIVRTVNMKTCSLFRKEKLKLSMFWKVCWLLNHNDVVLMPWYSELVFLHMSTMFHSLFSARAFGRTGALKFGWLSQLLRVGVDWRNARPIKAWLIKFILLIKAWLLSSLSLTST